jgi:16S rRNA (cytidine1402-2'-O)-methyltransferase
MAQLYVVATPIGNLEDITLRAVRVLREVDTIACEDTRHTRKLLEHFGISKPTVSYHEHNEAVRTTELLDLIRSGRSVALVSDAGTPLISDPGYRIVAAAIAEGIAVTPVPGPSAILAALSASGLPTESFRFCGFLPAKAGQRRKLLESVTAETATLVFYEAPHRIVDALQDMSAVFGERPAVLAREITKMHEEFLRGPLSEIAADLRERSVIRGEFTILIGRGDPVSVDSTIPIRDAVRGHESEGMSRMDAIKTVARERGLSKRETYRLFEEEK